MKDNGKMFVAILLCVIGSVVGKIVYHELAKPHNRLSANYEAENVNTKHADYSMSKAGDVLEVKVHDKVVNQTNKYNLKFDNGIENFEKNANKKYINENQKLVSDASKTYGFILANDYKAVKYCSQYYPVNNLKQKFDVRFKTKKQKAENILTKAYGINGPKEFEHAVLFKANTIQIFQEQTENDYLSVKKLAAQDGEPNFTRKQYCKMLDDAADFAVDEDFKKFKLMVPNF